MVFEDFLRQEVSKAIQKAVETSTRSASTQLEDELMRRVVDIKKLATNHILESYKTRFRSYRPELITAVQKSGNFSSGNLVETKKQTTRKNEVSHSGGESIAGNVAGEFTSNPEIPYRSQSPPEIGGSRYSESAVAFATNMPNSSSNSLPTPDASRSNTIDETRGLPPLQAICHDERRDEVLRLAAHKQSRWISMPPFQDPGLSSQHPRDAPPPTGRSTNPLAITSIINDNSPGPYDSFPYYPPNAGPDRAPRYSTPINTPRIKAIRRNSLPRVDMATMALVVVHLARWRRQHDRRCWGGSCQSMQI